MPFYYAVRSGRVPGVYKDWASCEAQVKNFLKARYKKFPTEAEASNFVRGEDNNTSVYNDEPLFCCPDDTEAPKMSSMNTSFEQKQQSETDSTGSESQTRGPDQSTTVQAIQMLRATAKALRSTAEQLMIGVDKLSTQIDQLAASVHLGGQGTTSSSNAFSPGASVRDNLKRSYSEFTPLGGSGGILGGKAGKDAAKKYKKMKQDHSGYTDCGFTGVPFADHEGKEVYTDGASFHNGCATARAGVGVYWGPHDPHNKSERLTGRQTNNRAEIHAAEIAVCQAKERGIQNLVLYTDSQFLINGITAWIKKWKKNGWKLSTGGDVINREDFEKLDKAISGINVKWMHVRGHQGIEGNEAADRLANAGARKPLE